MAYKSKMGQNCSMAEWRRLRADKERECIKLEGDIRDLTSKLEINEREHSELRNQRDLKERELRQKKEELQCPQQPWSIPQTAYSHEEVYARKGTDEKLGGARNMQIMGHQVVGSTDKSHEDVKMMFERFFGGDAVRIRRALRKELASIKTRKLLSNIFQVIYDYVQRKVVECLAKKAVQLAEAQQPQFNRSPSSWEREEGQFDPLFKHTELFTSCRDDQVAFRANMIEKQRKYGILLHNCDLMEMTDAKVEEETMEMKEKFNGRKISTRKRFRKVEDFNHTISIDQGLLDTYITGSIRLALLMVTRIPPMLAVEPMTFDPRCTVQDASWNDDVETQQITSMQLIVYFSYEGEVAVQGIVTNSLGSMGQDCTDDGHKATAVVKKNPSFHQSEPRS